MVAALEMMQLASKKSKLAVLHFGSNSCLGQDIDEADKLLTPNLQSAC
jgi:hypothetical protein